MVSQLQGVTPLQQTLNVTVANGNLLQCSSQVVKGQWSVQDCTFVSDLKVITLPCYDMVLGMDWLERFNPMKVDWLNKWVFITYNQNTVFLQGILPSIPPGTVVQLCMVVPSTETTAVQPEWPAYIQEILQEF